MPRPRSRALRHSLEHAARLHRSGSLEKAAQECRRLLLQYPDNPDALHLLGVIAFQHGEKPAAALLLSRAIQSGGPAAPYCESLATVLLNMDNPAAAAVCYRQALAAGAGGPEVHYRLGCALYRGGRPAEAAGALEQAIRLKPRFPEAFAVLGAAFCRLGALAESEAAYSQALALEPNDAETWCNRGLNAARQGDRKLARACFEEAIRIRPEYPEAHTNLGVLRHEDSPEEAVRHYRDALRSDPHHWQALFNLAQAQLDCSEPEEAERTCRLLLRRQPGHLDTRNHLGSALAALGRIDEAAAEFAAVLREADHRRARLNLGLLDLLRGRFREGWEGYRFRSERRDGREWEGETARGQRVLLYPEQGLGDMLQFVRYAPMVRRRGALVLVEAPRKLERLLADSALADVIVPQGGTIPFDRLAAIMDLPRIFGTDLDSIPGETPYLGADPLLVREWRDRLRLPAGRLKVGLAWQGNRANKTDRSRSMGVEELRPLGKVPNTSFVSLQQGVPEGGAGWSEPLPFVSLGRDLGDFADMAALMMNLDLVISVDTSVAHLAGALALPVWTMLPYAADWRWMLDRTETPWYPSMRLFRQAKLRDWAAVVAEVREELEETAAAK